MLLVIRKRSSAKEEEIELPVIVFQKRSRSAWFRHKLLSNKLRDDLTDLFRS